MYSWYVTSLIASKSLDVCFTVLKSGSSTYWLLELLYHHTNFAILCVLCVTVIDLSFNDLDLDTG